MRRRWAVAAFDPNGMPVGNTGRKFLTLWGAEREQRRYNTEPRVRVPQITDGKIDMTRPSVPLTTYRVVELL